MRLNPYHPERFWSHLGRAYFAAKRYDEARSEAEAALRIEPGYPAALAVLENLRVKQ